MSLYEINSKNSHRECITVVIPTMLLCPKDMFKYTLDQLNSNDLIKKIIIIDNTDDKSFDKFYKPTIKTYILRMIGNQGATYNSGMELCKTEYYLLINDDVACRSSIIDSCFDIMEQDENIGLLQIETGVCEPLQYYINTFKNKETQYIFPTNPRSCMTGWFQFGRTKEWVPIPKELKYFYGDDLMLDIMRFNNKKVARIVSDHISHMVSSTVRTVVPTNSINEEKPIYHEILKRICKK